MAVQSTYNVTVPLRQTAGSEFFALFNTLAGSLDVIDLPVKAALQAFDKPNCGNYIPSESLAASLYRNSNPVLTADVQNYLSGRGYIFASPAEETTQSRL